MLSRNPDDFLRETSLDIHKTPRSYAPEAHPFQAAREYQRALNATKLERIFAKPFLGSLSGHSEGVGALAPHPLALSTLASGAYDGEIRLWDLPRKRCLAKVQAHSGWVRGIAFNPQDGNSFLSVGDDKAIKHWPLRLNGTPEAEYPEPSFTVLSKNMLLGLSHHYKRTQFATCGSAVEIWDEGRGSPLRSLQWGSASVHGIRYNGVETEILAAVAADRSVILYDQRAQVPLHKMTMKLRSNAVAWNPMEAFIFSLASEDYNAYTFDMRNLKAPLNVHMDHTEAVMDLAYSPTGREFVTASYDRSLRIFPVERGRSREVYHTKRMQRVMTVAWSGDGKFLVSGSDEMNLRLWKAAAAEKLGPLRPREEAAFRYQEALRDKYAQHPQLKRIARHRQVPKHIRNAAREHRTIRESQKRKESNRRRYSKPGSVPHVPERQKHVLKEED